MNPLSSELPFHVHKWLIISLQDFCIVIRKWPTFWPSILTRAVTINRFESIQVANRLIDSKLLNRFTETIHYFYLLNGIVPENANKLIFIKHNKQYYTITVTG